MVLVCKFMLLSVQMFYLKVQICPEKCLARFLIVTKGGRGGGEMKMQTRLLIHDRLQITVKYEVIFVNHRA